MWPSQKKNQLICWHRFLRELVALVFSKFEVSTKGERYQVCILMCAGVLSLIIKRFMFRSLA